MEDRELRSLVLKAFYERRKSNDFLTPQPDWFHGQFSEDDGPEVGRICKQLADKGYIEWLPNYDIGSGRITARGSEAIEGEEENAFINISNIHNSVTIANSTGNIAVGASIKQSTGEGVSAVIHSIQGDVSLKPEEKNQLIQMIKQYGLPLIVKAAKRISGNA